MSDLSSDTLTTILEVFGKTAVVQAAVAAAVFVWIYQKVIKPGEKDVPTSDLQARWQAQQNLKDISENVKTMVTLQHQTYEVVKRLVDLLWNDHNLPPPPKA